MNDYNKLHQSSDDRTAGSDVLRRSYSQLNISPPLFPSSSAFGLDLSPSLGHSPTLPMVNGGFHSSPRPNDMYAHSASSQSRSTDDVSYGPIAGTEKFYRGDFRSKSQDMFENCGEDMIYQQRPNHVPRGPSVFHSNSSGYPGSSVPSRNMTPIMRNHGGMHSKPVLFQDNLSTSSRSYQNQFKFSYDQAYSSANTFEDELYRESPLRTPAVHNHWNTTDPISSPPFQRPSASSAPYKFKDAKRSPDSVDGYIYQVQFKRAHRNFVLAPSAPRDIIPGDFVKVEADRGEDMGIVLAKIPVDSFEEAVPTAGYRGRGFSSGPGERKFLFRRANQEERKSLTQKVIDEEIALRTVREKSREKALPMVVLDAEYQFDRHKLTFYFEADKRIDFRELVSELFSQYKTRIWMQQVDTSSLAIHDPGMDLARATGFLPEGRDDDYSSFGRSPSFGSAGTSATFDTADSFKGNGIGPEKTVVASSLSSSVQSFYPAEKWHPSHL